MNNLHKSLVTEDDFNSIEDLISTVDLYGIYEALGKDAYMDMMSIYFSMPDLDDRIVFLTSLDKLLHSNRKIEYVEGTCLRRITPKDEFSIVGQLTLTTLFSYNIPLLEDELPNIGSYLVIEDLLMLTNVLNASKENEDSKHLTNFILAEKFKDYVENNSIRPDDIISGLYNVDKSNDSKVKQFFDTLEPEESGEYLVTALKFILSY